MEVQFFLVVLCIGAVLGIPLEDASTNYGQNELHQLMSDYEMRASFGVKHKREVPEYDTFSRLESSRFQSDANSTTGVPVALAFHALDRDFRVNLQSNDALANHGHVVEYHHADGTVTRTVHTQSKHSIGKLEDDANSLVALSHNGGLSGIISTKKDAFVIKPIPSRLIGTDKRGHDHIVFRATSKGEEVGRRSCGFKDDDPVNQKRSRTQESKRGSDSTTRRKAKTMEILVAGDKSMVEFHGKDFLPTYLVAVVNIAAGIFQSQSMTYPVTLAVVRVVVFEDAVFGSPKSMSDLLVKWNVWVNSDRSTLTGGDSNPLYADNAILMTRNECADGCSIAGLAYFGVCTDSSQNVIKDKGIGSGLTAAHELSHNLKVSHDGSADEKACNDGVNLMASSVVAGPHSTELSNCTIKSIERVMMDDTLSSCFDDQPSKMLNDVNVQLYGQIYSADKQCAMSYGKGYTYCGAVPSDCVLLMCRIPNSASCIVAPYPLAQGTPCGTGKWCIQSKCVPSGSAAPAAINGGWSEWSDFSKCNRDCGVGVQFKVRECNNPTPSNGGEQCPGDSSGHYKTCNSQDCPSGTPSFRQQQCTKKNTTSEPLVNANNVCQLFCGSGGIGPYYGYAEPGTRCPDTDSSGICIVEECKILGCDNQLESGQIRDRCGICGGDGSKCSRTFGQSDLEYASGRETHLVRIPAGAKNIVVKELAPSINFLGVKAGDSNTFVIPIPSYTASAKIYSATMKYDMDAFSYADKITISGTLEQDISVYVLNFYGGVCKGITWEYFDNTPASTVQMDWGATAWGACSRTCSGGVQTRDVTCQRMDDHSEVSSHYCASGTKLATSRTCNEQLCPAQWHLSEYSACSRSCGQGVKTRTISCCREGANNACTPADVGQCTETKPSDPVVAACNQFTCTARWETAEWSACSASCGNGEQTRMAHCKRLNSAGVDLLTSRLECTNLPAPTTSRVCTIQGGSISCPSD